jgi:hypothetical protein
MERWQIEGTDIALEFQTNRTPTQGKYYLYRADRVVKTFQSRSAGVAAYRQLRHQIWCSWLASTDPELRLSAARGIWYHEKETLETVVAVLWQDGTEHDRTSIRAQLSRLCSIAGGAWILVPRAEPPPETENQGQEAVAATQAPSPPKARVP